LQLLEKSVTIPAASGKRGLIEHIEKALTFRLTDGEVPIRLAITSIEDDQYSCEIGCVVGSESGRVTRRRRRGYWRHAATS
jgi:hypothetical protein